MKKTGIVLLSITFFLIFLFVFSASKMIFEKNSYLELLQQLKFSKNNSKLALLVLTAIQAVLSVTLFFPFLRKAGLYGSFILLSSYSLFLGYMLGFIDDLPCSCLGPIRHMGWGWHLILTLGCMVLAFIGILLERRIHKSSKKKGNDLDRRVIYDSALTESDLGKS